MREQRSKQQKDNVKKALFQKNQNTQDNKAATGLEFDVAQFDGQGKSNRRQNGQFGTAQQNFHPKQNHQEFDDDSYGEEEQSSGHSEEGELNSAQKQKLKRDLLMMGYDEDEEFGDEVNDQQIKQLVHDPALAALTAMPLDGAPDLAQTPELQKQLEAMAAYEKQ